ncbi:MAG: nucleoside-diphosphate kinase [Desulfovibrionaceae bacterium]
MSELTFSIVKPDAVAAGKAGAILQMIADAGFKFRGMKMIQLTKAQAEGFYAVHKARPFFGELVEFMTSGPVVVSAIEAENAVVKYRELMGPTDSTKAPKGTIRGEFGTNIQNNACHGSDSPENAAIEVAYFFNRLELVG